MYTNRMYDYAFMCALYKITGTIPQEHTLSVGGQELVESFGKLICACLRHSIMPYIQDASTDLAEFMAVPKVGAKLARFKRMTFSIVESGDVSH